MKRMKKAVALFLVAATALSLTACGSFDPVKYTKSVLDLAYKGETKDYMATTNSSEEEATKLYDDNIDDVTDLIESSSGYPMSDDMKDKYADLMKKIMGETKYTVGKSKKDGDSYTVDVEIEPLQAFDGMTDELTSQISQYAQSNDVTTLTQDDISDLVYGMLYDILDKKADDPTYGEKTTVTVTVEKSDDGKYEITDKSYQEIDAAMFDMTAI